MIPIRLEQFHHNAMSCLAIKFPYGAKVKKYVQAFGNVRYSKTFRTFYIVYDETRHRQLEAYLLAGGYTIQQKKVHHILKTRSGNNIKLPVLTEQKQQVYEDFLEFLKGKRFSKSTVLVYGNFILNFLRHTGTKDVYDLDENDVRLYIEFVVKKLNYAISTHRQLISAIKHFAYFYPACVIDMERVYMPMKDRKLPVVLSIEEVLLLLQRTKNLKHRMVIAMLYGSGLRIGELLNLKLSHFDFERKQIRIVNAKGRKERYASIATSLFPMLKNYYATYGPKEYFVENPKGGPYSPTTIRSFLKKSCKLAGITKHVTPHTLRHSYATHLMEQGTGLRHIQELLGHTRPETTMIYTHVTRKDLEQINSPLDNIVKGDSMLYIDDGNASVF